MQNQTIADLMIRRAALQGIAGRIVKGETPDYADRAVFSIDGKEVSFFQPSDLGFIDMINNAKKRHLAARRAYFEQAAA